MKKSVCGAEAKLIRMVTPVLLLPICGTAHGCMCS